MMKSSAIKGIFGATIFAIIGSIPWILYYYVFDGPLFIYGLLIPFGAYNGYRLFHGPQSKYQITIHTIVSVILSTVCSYVVMPILYLIRNENEVSLFSYLDTFKWIEVNHELFRNYLIMIVSVVVGIIIIYTIYIPYLISKKEDYEYRQKMLGTTDNSLNGIYFDQNIHQESSKTLKKPLFISIIIVLVCLCVFIPKTEYVLKQEENNTKHITNEWFEYDTPDKYLVYKYGDSSWLVMDLSSEEENKNGVSINYHTILEGYNTEDILYDYLYEGFNDDEEVNIKSSLKNNYTNNGYQYFEFVFDNYKGATHTLDYVIDENFEYCVIVECICYNDNPNITEVRKQIVDSLKINNEVKIFIVDFIRNVMNNAKIIKR